MFSEASKIWRKHPLLQQSSNLARALPGLGTAAAIFGTYLFVERMYELQMEKQQKAAAKVGNESGAHADADSEQGH